jgi:hypothetical protein
MGTNQVKLFLHMDKLPLEIIDIIYEYIPIWVKAVLTKKNYMKNHLFLYTKITNLELYIRNMVRRDYDFVFSTLLNENYNKWLNMNHYFNNHCIYINYLYFLKSYCIEQNSDRCRKIIVKLLQDVGLSTNQHKKKIIRYV